MSEIMNTSLLGSIGEEAAVVLLKSKGYKIVARNIWRRWGEIDIVARAKDGCLIFVEVKTRQGIDQSPEQNYTFAKHTKTVRAVQLYMQKHPTLIYEQAGIRIDLIAVKVLFEKDDGKKCKTELVHYENIAV